MNTNYDRYTPEQLLLGAIRDRDADPDERSCAIQELRERHQRTVIKIVSQKLPPDLVEDVVQEIWIDTIEEVIAEGIKKGFRNLLVTIAYRRRADAVRARSIEDKHFASLEEYEKAEEETYEKRLYDDYDYYWERKQLFDDFISKKSYLSDTKKTILMLRTILEYTPSVVARLTGKNVENINAQFSYALRKLENYSRSEEYRIDLDHRQMREPFSPLVYKGSYIDRALWEQLDVACNLANFSSEELHPVGLTVREAHNYCARMFLPYLASNGKYQRLVLAIRERTQTIDNILPVSGFEEMLDAVIYASKNISADNQYSVYNMQLSPNETLVLATAERNNIILHPLHKVRNLYLQTH